MPRTTAAASRCGIKSAHSGRSRLAVFMLAILLTACGAKAPSSLASASSVSEPEGPTTDRASDWTIARARIQLADQDLEASLAALTEDIEAFFEAKKSGIPGFSEATQTLSSAYAMLSDGDLFRDRVRESFAAQVIAVADIKLEVNLSVARLQSRVAASEARLLIDLEADLPLVIDADQAAADLNPSVTSMAMAENATHVATDACLKATSQLVASIPLSLSIQGLVLRALPVIASKGGIYGFALGLMVDLTVIEVLRLMDDPEAELEARISAEIDRLCDLVLAGDPVAWQDLEATARLAAADEFLELREQATQIHELIEAGGHLGLRHEIQNRLDQIRKMRTAALEGLILGVHDVQE